ncbi:MAG: hypothetical protein CMH64_03665 [Nanoarchaeota archaeon]|nr:hypothetical protein [Nanoarchaeota archaeon]|tara:strand:- start:132 stop:692 length:561 start_codon:yes stop_codon:yes gene_type:complete
MKKVDIFFVILLAIGLVSFYNVEFKNSTGNYISSCFDSDGGIEPMVGGNVIGFDESVKRDFCFDDNTLYEYFCLDGTSKGLVDVIKCENGCVDEEGKARCLEKGEVTLGELKFNECDNGCYSKGVCIDVGVRINNGFYCDIDEELNVFVLDGDTCTNNFECKSNLCIASQCISEEVFVKFLESISE